MELDNAKVLASIFVFGTKGCDLHKKSFSLCTVREDPINDCLLSIIGLFSQVSFDKSSIKDD